MVRYHHLNRTPLTIILTCRRPVLWNVELDGRMVSHTTGTVQANWYDDPVQQGQIHHSCVPETVIDPILRAIDGTPVSVSTDLSL